MNHQDTKTPSKVIEIELDKLAHQVVDAAFQVHKALGPGLLESAYETCLSHELGKRGVAFKRQVEIPVVYDGVKIETGFRIDLLVGDKLVVELKAVDALHDIHTAQLLTYLKLTDTRLGLLINFNVPMIKHGIKRIAL